MRSTLQKDVISRIFQIIWGNSISANQKGSDMMNMIFKLEEQVVRLIGQIFLFSDVSDSLNYYLVKMIVIHEYKL